MCPIPEDDSNPKHKYLIEQRNRAASINSANNDALPTILSNDKDRHSDQVWEFAVDSDFFDPSMETQDDTLDQFLHNTPPPEKEEPTSVEVVKATSSAVVLNKPEIIAKNTDILQDSYSRLLAIFPQPQFPPDRCSDGQAYKTQQPTRASDRTQMGGKSSVCCGMKATMNDNSSFSWSHAESRSSTDNRSGDSIPQEVCFERIQEFVEDAGFESLESMMAAYYSSSFNAGTSSKPAQAVGRSRRLRSFLSAIHRNHTSWGEQERSTYREEIVRAAEGIYADELSTMVHGATENSSSRTLSMAGSSKPSAETSRVYIAHRLQNIISDHEIQEFMRKDRKELQDTVSILPIYIPFYCGC